MTRHAPPQRRRVASASTIRRRLKVLADPSRVQGLQRFFKTRPGEYAAGDRFLGISVPALRQVAAAHHALPLRQTADLLKSRWHEERLVALLILVRQYHAGDAAKRAAIHRCYVRNRRHVNNWDLVDLSAEHLVGAHLRRSERGFLRRLAASPVLWDRRIAILATLHYVKEGQYGDTLAIARLLLDDPHDLIHKAVGWMLREIGKRDRTVEEKFLLRYAPRMPRTMLRYAIERFPKKTRHRYLALR